MDEGRVFGIVESYVFDGIARSNIGFQSMSILESKHCLTHVKDFYWGL